MRIKLAIYLLLITETIISQSFEGTIEFRYFTRNVVSGMLDRKVEMPGMPVLKIIIKKDRLKLMSDAFNENRYILVVDSGEYTVILTDEKIHKQISKRQNDPLVATNEYLKKYANKSRKKEKIQGFDCTKYTCKRLNKGREEMITYWLADSIQAFFTNTCMIKGLGVILKTVSTINNKEIIIEATKISKEKINDSIFEMPLYQVEEIDIDKLMKKQFGDDY